MRRSYSSTFQKWLLLTSSIKPCAEKAESYCIQWLWSHQIYIYTGIQCLMVLWLPLTSQSPKEKEPLWLQNAQGSLAPTNGSQALFPSLGNFVTPCQPLHLCFFFCKTRSLGLVALFITCIHLGWAHYRSNSLKRGTGMQCATSHVTVATKRAQWWNSRATGVFSG